MVILLPDEEWRAVLAFGTNLVAGFEAALVRGVVRERWPIVAGTITISQLPPPEECGEAVAHFAAWRPRGPTEHASRIGDFDVRNAGWGCLVGLTSPVWRHRPEGVLTERHPSRDGGSCDEAATTASAPCPASPT